MSFSVCLSGKVSRLIHISVFCVLSPQVLVVQEKTGRFQGQGIWKFPTGVVNEVLLLFKSHYMFGCFQISDLFLWGLTQGEYIHDGSVREVKEETGVSLSSFITSTL